MGAEEVLWEQTLTVAGFQIFARIVPSGIECKGDPDAPWRPVSGPFADGIAVALAKSAAYWQKRFHAAEKAATELLAVIDDPNGLRDEFDAALDALHDSLIDTSEIPEMTPEQIKEARLTRFGLVDTAEKIKTVREALKAHGLTDEEIEKRMNSDEIERLSR